MNIIERIYQIIDYYGVSVNEFSKKIGVSNGYFAKQKRANANVGSQIIEKIVSIYADIDVKWLITGNGEMLLNTDPDKKEDDGYKAMYSDLQDKYIDLKGKYIDLQDKYAELQQEVKYQQKGDILSELVTV